MTQTSDQFTTPYRSLTQIVVEALRQRIFEGQYAPGMRLNIADLAETFGASPVPVREALRNLEAEGLIEFRHNRGAIVRVLSYADVRELSLMRTPLESLAAAEAARLATPKDVSELANIVAKMEKNLGTDAWHRAHALFHRRLYALSRLPRVTQLIEGLRGQMRPYSKIYLKDRDHILRAQEEHRQILDCLRSNDAEGIARIVAVHVERPAHMAMAVFEGGADQSGLATNAGRTKKRAARGPGRS